jgi:creatinine amidohydrolase/Fe(II)-dependent formamide hydrolase-like protein
VRERVMPNTQLDLGMQNSIATGVGYFGGLIVIMIASMVLGIDFSAITEGARGREHGGEVLTSLMLHLYPERVDLTRATDYWPPGDADRRTRRLHRLSQESPGVVGEPSRASAEKGRLIFELILQRVRARVFLAAEETAEP